MSPHCCWLDAFQLSATQQWQDWILRVRLVAANIVYLQQVRLFVHNITTAAQYLVTGTDRCLPVTGCRFGLQPSWLLQLCAGWATCQLDPASSVHSKHCSTTDFWPLPFWTHNECARQSSIALYSRVRPLQTRYSPVNGVAAVYLSSYFTWVTNVAFQLRLQSILWPTDIASCDLATVNRWTFPVSAANLWSTLHLSTTSHNFPGSVLRLFSSGAAILT